MHEQTAMITKILFYRIITAFDKDYSEMPDTKIRTDRHKKRVIILITLLLMASPGGFEPPLPP